MKRLLFLLGAILALPTLLVLTQETSTANLDITGINATQLPTTVITANLLDNSQKPIVDLGIDDFVLEGELAEVGRVVSVENVTREDLNFSAVLVIDSSSSMAGTPIEKSREAAELFVNALGANDFVSLITFNSSVRVVRDFTTDKADVIQAIRTLGFGGRTALYKATVEAIEKAATAPTNRRAVIILSDGAEFGGLSDFDREQALTRAEARGVTVYTIGLGFNSDLSFLTSLAQDSYGQFYASPTPEQLSGIYQALANQFRSQYVITLEADVPANGEEYDFTLFANTPFGQSNIVAGTVRAPIPVPIITLPDGIFDAPLSETVTVAPLVRADDIVNTITVTIDGQEQTLRNNTFTINPATLTPGDHELNINALDSTGDTGTLTTTFQVGALASAITVSADPDSTVIEGLTTYTVTGVGQTPLANVVYSIGDVTAESTDPSADFAFELDPFGLPAGEATLSIVATNEGGVSTEETLALLIAPQAPREVRLDGLSDGDIISEPVTFSVLADAQEGTELSDVSLSVGDQTVTEFPFTLDPIAFPVGDLDLIASVTDANGLTTEQAFSVVIEGVAPRATLDGLVVGEVNSAFEVPFVVDSQSPLQSVSVAIGDTTLEGDPTQNSVAIDPEAIGLEAGDYTAVITLTDENGQTQTLDVPFTYSPSAPPTATGDAEATAEATSDVEATAEATSDVGVEVTADVEATLEPEVTAEATLSSEELTAQAEVSQTAQFAEFFTATAQSAQATTTTQSAEATTTAQFAEFFTATAQSAQATTTAQAAEATTTAQAIAEATSQRGTQQAIDSVQSTRDSRNAQSTANAVSSSTAQVSIGTSTAEAISTTRAQNAQATLDADATLTAQPTSTNTPEPEPTATPTLEPTVEPTVTNTPPPATFTPVGAIQTDGGQAPVAPQNLTPYLFCGAALIVLLILLFILTRRKPS